MIGPGTFFVVLVVAATVTIYYIIRSKHIENMARIEHGMMEDDNSRGSSPLLNMGIFLCFLGGGFLLAYLISNNSTVPEYVAMPTCLLFSGGIGLIVSYLINSNLQK